MGEEVFFFVKNDTKREGLKILVVVGSGSADDKWVKETPGLITAGIRPIVKPLNLNRERSGQ